MGGGVLGSLAQNRRQYSSVKKREAVRIDFSKATTHNVAKRQENLHGRTNTQDWMKCHQTTPVSYPSHILQRTHFMPQIARIRHSIWRPLEHSSYLFSGHPIVLSWGQVFLSAYTTQNACASVFSLFSPEYQTRANLAEKNG